VSALVVIRLILSVILGTAGVVHLVRPEVFLPAMPPYVPWHRPVILLTGVLELAAAAGLWIPRIARFTAWCLVVYFVAILPAHFHVAIHGIAMFGINDPALLWGRAAFQAVFIGAAYWLARKGAA
jgi:uncharacterized membrane protein